MHTEKVYIYSLKSEPVLLLISRAAPSVEANYRSVGPDTGRNSGGRWIIKKAYTVVLSSQASSSMLAKLKLNMFHAGQC